MQVVNSCWLQAGPLHHSPGPRQRIHPLTAAQQQVVPAETVMIVFVSNQTRSELDGEKSDSNPLRSLVAM